MWGSGGGAGVFGGGGGGAYVRSVVPVTPGEVYGITVGGGGLPDEGAQNGGPTFMSLGGTVLLWAEGGFGGLGGFGGKPDPSAAIGRYGMSRNSSTGAAGAAAGSSFCPNGEQTGAGGTLFGRGEPGYILLTW
jgi:hypothetical protein